MLVDAPAAGAVVLEDAVRHVLPAGDLPLLLLVTDIDIVAVDADGRAWRSARLAVDGVEVISADAGGIRCMAWQGERELLTLDPTSGRVTPGPALPA